MVDERILDLCFAVDEQAVAETDRKYGGYCISPHPARKTMLPARTWLPFGQPSVIIPKKGARR